MKRCADMVCLDRYEGAALMSLESFALVGGALKGGRVVTVSGIRGVAAAPDVSHAVLPQHAWALTAGSKLVVKLAAGAHWDCDVSWLAALCKHLLFVIAKFRALKASSNSVSQAPWRLGCIGWCLQRRMAAHQAVAVISNC